MLASYFKICLRFLGKSKLYSFINIAGLSVGLACAMLILLYTKDELSFDAFHQNAPSIYQVTVEVRHPDGSSQDKMGMSSILLGPYLKSTLPEVRSYLRLATTFWNVRLGDAVQSQSVMLVDNNFFELLTFPLLHGNPKMVLRQPNDVVVSEDLAIRHFGTTDAIGKTLLFESSGKFEAYMITGVAKRPPQNSSIQFEVVVPLATKAEELRNDRWVSIDVNTLIQLFEGSDVTYVANKIQMEYEAVSKTAFESVRAMGFDQMFYHGLQPLREIHLSTDFKAAYGFVNGSDPVYSYILSGIALFILVVACINFVNLTIARSIKRAKEIGIRKVVGSGRQQLILQFLGESLFLCSVSFAGALFVAQLALPLFNQLANKNLSLSYLMDLNLKLGYLILFLATSFLAGMYPAIVLSRFMPVHTLYNQFKLSGKNYLQKGLVVFQFTLATSMILATLTMYQQFEYLTKKDLGYDADNLIRVANRHLTTQQAKLFREQLMKNPNIVLAAPFWHSMMNAKIAGDSIRHFTYEVVDENFLDILKLQLVKGRNFSSEFPSDSSQAVLVNEAFVKMAGFEDPIGQGVNFFLTDTRKMIVGVVKDYHFESLRGPIKPQCFAAKPDSNDTYRQMLIRIKPNSEASALPYIEKVFRTQFPVLPFAYHFEDDQNRQQYAAEARWRKIVLWGTLLMIITSGLGLFGLAILTAEKRLKEIGIRRVLGASVQSVTFTLTKDFLLLISIALVVAMPIGYFAASTWLENYAYRIEVTTWTFVVTSTLVLAIAIITVGYQSVKAASVNPVESLKRE